MTTFFLHGEFSPIEARSHTEDIVTRFDFKYLFFFDISDVSEETWHTKFLVSDGKSRSDHIPSTRMHSALFGNVSLLRLRFGSQTLFESHPQKKAHARQHR